jgi:ABC-2 type transport system ATP-binding protein
VSIQLESVRKVFRSRPALFNLVGREATRPTVALDDVSASLEFGRVTVLLGENGSGKTTLLKLIATMLLPDSGRIRVDGKDTRTDAAEIRRAVGFAVATERSFYPRLTARENLEFFAALEEVPRPERRARIDQVLATVELLDSADVLVMKFSSGMYQRLGIARAMLKQPRILLLDEPTRSLDPAAAEHLWQWIARAVDIGATCVLATHQFDEAVAVGHSALLLHAGKLRARRDIAPGLSPRELRDFYFQAASEPAAAGGGTR